MTFWRRFVAWKQGGIFERLYEQGLLNTDYAIVDSGSVRAVWGQKIGSNPTAQAKAGTKHNVLTEANGGKPSRPDPVAGTRRRPSPDPHWDELRRRYIDPVLAERNATHGSGLYVLRWPVERTISWLH